MAGLTLKSTKPGERRYRIGRVPRNLWPIGERNEPRFGKLGREYATVIFDKELLKHDATLEWVTPGHPLFEAVREDVLDHVREDIRHGAVFFDINAAAPSRLDVFHGAVSDGRGNAINKRLFVVQTMANGELFVRQPTIFLDLTAPEAAAGAPAVTGLPERAAVEDFLITHALQPMLHESQRERAREVSIISRHIEISLGEIMNRENLLLADLIAQREAGSSESGLEGRIKISEDKLLDLDHRLQSRRRELEQERQCSISDIHHLGRAWIVPHPDRASPSIAPMVADPEIERCAVRVAIAHEEAQGRVVESVEADNRGFDLISRLPHPEDAKTAIDVRFIEVKGRAHHGEIALTSNEYRTAQRLAKDYYLYVVLHCATEPSLNIFQDPAKLDWQPVVKVEHYKLRVDSPRRPVVLREDAPEYGGEKG